jgi:hypothetical protein
VRSRVGARSRSMSPTSTRSPCAPPITNDS